MEPKTARDSIFSKLQDKFGTHKEAAKSLGISERQYSNWRISGLKGKSTASMVADLIRKTGINVTPEDLIDGVDMRKMNRKASN